MMHLEAMEFIDRELRARWPDWEPTAAQIADWVEWLKPYPAAAVLTAVRQHAAESRWKSPSPQAVLAACRQTALPARRTVAGIVTTFLVLIEPGTPPVGRPGWMIELAACDGGGRMLADNDETGRLAAANGYIRKMFGDTFARFEIFLNGDQARTRRHQLIERQDAQAAACAALPPAGQTQTPW